MIQYKNYSTSLTQFNLAFSNLPASTAFLMLVNELNGVLVITRFSTDFGTEPPGSKCAWYSMITFPGADGIRLQ